MSPRQLHGIVAGVYPTHLSSDCPQRHSAHTHNVSVTKNVDRTDLNWVGFWLHKSQAEGRESMGVLI